MAKLKRNAADGLFTKPSSFQAGSPLFPQNPGRGSSPSSFFTIFEKPARKRLISISIDAIL
jgi:hypothetical protein